MLAKALKDSYSYEQQRAITMISYFLRETFDMFAHYSLNSVNCLVNFIEFAHNCTSLQVNLQFCDGPRSSWISIWHFATMMLLRPGPNYRKTLLCPGKVGLANRRFSLFPKLYNGPQSTLMRRLMLEDIKCHLATFLCSTDQFFQALSFQLHLDLSKCRSPQVQLLSQK